MKKYLLVECCERRLTISKIFDTFEQAYVYMCKRASEVSGLTIEELQNGDAYEFGLSSRAAYATTSTGENYDCEIFEFCV